MSSNIFLGTKSELKINIGDTIQSIPHGELFVPSYEDDAEMYVDNYLSCGWSGSYPYINIFKNEKDGYKLIFKTYIPDWKYKPIDWSVDEGEEYSTELFRKIIDSLFE